VTDALACQVILGVSINEVEPFSVEINMDQPLSCENFSLASLSLNVDGATSEYTVEWNDGSTDIERHNLGSGEYQVSVTDVNGCSASANIIIEDTGSCTSVISGSVWEDQNRDGTRDSDDSSLIDQLIIIYTADDRLVDSMRSNENGIYSFANLPGGDYYLRTEITPEFRITQDNFGSDNAFNNSTSSTGILTVETNGTLDNIDLGLYRLGKISGIVWSDSDKDGILDENETGLAQIQVMLLDNDAELLASTFSDIDGSYSFTNLPPGSYFIEFNKPEALNVSPVGQGDDPAKQSYADVETNRTSVIVVESGDCYESINAGLFGLFDLELVLSASTETPAPNSLVSFSIMIKNNGDRRKYDYMDWSEYTCWW